MNLLGAFLELDKLYESANWTDRDTLIKDIKASGKNYNFDKYSDAQLYRMWERIQNDIVVETPPVAEPLPSEETCKTCGERLNPLGQCPICDLGEGDLLESVDALELGNHITDNYIFPSASAKYDCIMALKSKYQSFDDLVSQHDIDNMVAKFGGKLTENKKALTEALEDDFLSIDGFDHYIEDTFEDEGYTGYEVVYSKNGKDIVKAEIWEVDDGVTVIENLYAPNLMQRTYETFVQFAEDLAYKCDKYLHEATIKNWKGLLTEAAELSMDHAVNSIVDQVKAVYEAGLFTKLPTGRENAFTLEISGPDKERLTGYFQKQPEFNYELNNDSGIVSHEFISNEYDVEIFDTFISMYKIPQNESLKEWKDANGNAVSVTQNSKAQPPANQPSQSANAANIVTIVYDAAKGKLRAQADDGIHGKANVAFPNNLRNQPGQQYEVETLIWNGKNYRASGKITAINSVSNTATTINENLFKETNEMNFQTILEELDRLYEETQRIAFIDSTGSHTKETEAKYSERAAADGFSDIRIITDSSMKELADCVKAGNDVTLYTDDDDYKYNTDVADMKNFNAVMLSNLQEDAEADDAEILIDDEPIIDDEVAEDAVVEEEVPTQLILECSKCGGIIIKDETDVEVDDETDLANVKEKCKYCEEAEGYKILGAMVPYDGAVVSDDAEAAEAVEDTDEATTESLTEGKLIDNVKKVATRVGADTATILRSFTELGEIIANVGNDDEYKTTKLNDFMQHVEDKAVFKALMNGNETVLNGTTKEDLEDLVADIEEYKKEKADKKVGKASDKEDLEELLDVDLDVPVTIKADNNEVAVGGATI